MLVDGDGDQVPSTLGIMVTPVNPSVAGAFFLGGSGNDILFGGLGNDIINGDAGVDTAGFVGFSRQYSIGFHGQTVNGPEGFDQLTDIEIIQFADGRMVYDQGDAAAIVYRMYDSAFGRAPESDGQNGWTTALQKGLSVADMASGFAGSQEFVATYGPLDNQHFVEQLYRNVLDREGEAAGVAGWTNALNTHTMSRGQVLAGFSESNEHIQKLAPVVSAGICDVNETTASVARLYDAAFNRLPDGNGLLGWKDAVDHGMSLSTVADGFVFSAEFQNTYGNLSNQGFVEQLYHNVLDRAGEAAGVAGWTAALASGQMDRGDVLLGFSESLEHQLNTAMSSTMAFGSSSDVTLTLCSWWSAKSSEAPELSCSFRIGLQRGALCGALHGVDGIFVGASGPSLAQGRRSYLAQCASMNPRLPKRWRQSRSSLVACLPMARNQWCRQ